MKVTKAKGTRAEKMDEPEYKCLSLLLQQTSGTSGPSSRRTHASLPFDARRFMTSPSGMPVKMVTLTSWFVPRMMLLR